MPLPSAPTKLGSRLKNIPDELEVDVVIPNKKRLSRKSAPKVENKEASVNTSVPGTDEVISTKPTSLVNEGRIRKIRHKRAGAESSGVKKLYVLDTNVLLHDPLSLFRFEEHDVYLPMITLEELDNHKSGITDVARNARQVSRSLDAMMQYLTGSITDGVDLNVLGHRDCTGKLFIQTKGFDVKIDLLPDTKADNQILTVVEGLQRYYSDRHVVLVSKDINMRLKATALNLKAEDYFNDKIIEDTDLLYTGSLKLSDDFWEEHSKDLQSWQDNGSTWYRITGALASRLHVNEFVWLEKAEIPFYGQVCSVDRDTATIRMLRDYTNPKNSVWGISARNREQAFALDLLMNPEIDFVTLLGQAGTGKTLLALASALTQTMEMRRFNEIIITRATISVGEDIGFLPGTEEEKMTPWLGAIDDNLEVLNRGDSTTSEWGRRASNDLIRSRIRIKSMNFMRGRTFLNKFVIIDEAQNLTPKQMKTLITRAGPGTKIVCLGNIAQIDTPYLTEGSSGLTYVVDRFKGWQHAGHITMQRGERSRLADYATEVL